MNTRVPFDDDYVKLVGTAVYLFSYYEWAIIYVVERLQPGFLPEYCRKHLRGQRACPTPHRSARVWLLNGIYTLYRAVGVQRLVSLRFLVRTRMAAPRLERPYQPSR